jgi:2-polyprenyl-3-methyl-5-hydroxy-6-metoxy-1,4-benzoquinol methylase
MEIKKNSTDGIAYQVDRSKPIQYNIKYIKKLDKYRENIHMHESINKARVELVKEYVSGWKHVLDIGCGNLDFLKELNKSYILSHGYEVIPKSVDELKELNAYVDISDKDNLYEMDAVTMWDVLEHLKEPKEVLDKIPTGCLLMVSIPIFETFHKLEESRHYRPNEHLWYFTHSGFIAYMEGWQLLEYNDRETELGREGIRTYVFRKRA